MIRYRFLQFLCFVLGALSSVTFSHAQDNSALRLVPHAIRLSTGRNFSLNIPEGFEISVAAQGLRRVRFMTQATDGRIFATDMYDRSDNSQGTVYILDGFDPKSGKFERVTPYLRHLRNPNNVAFYTDSSGQTWLYLALTDKLERFRFHAGEKSPSSAPEVLATYPDYGLNYKYGGWHLTRTVAFGEGENKDKLYVTVGSSCNECEEKEEIRAAVSVMNPDGKNAHIIGRGLRNAVGLRWVDDTLYATNMGADHLGDDAPDDTMLALATVSTDPSESRNYGWPYCYFKDGKAFDDPTFTSSPKKTDCAKVPAPFATFAAHSAPLGLEYIGADSKHPVLQNYFLVALHGSSKKRLNRGYRVVRLKDQSPPEDFITGFIKNGVIFGRPCGILKIGSDAFLLTDDHSGVIYYIGAKP
ncbi:MAG: glucose / Sorbosone dehydrogenase family protein [Acidobacteriaceae bacterium]|nr:glucose / Sorbosone dehydrogenase family protein [Acidobacteriaceae bacterium]